MRCAMKGWVTLLPYLGDVTSPKYVFLDVFLDTRMVRKARMAIRPKLETVLCRHSLSFVINRPKNVKMLISQVWWRHRRSLDH